MAAIWGVVSNNGVLKSQAPKICDIYRKKTKLDRIIEKESLNYYFGAGYIFLHKYDENEKMPIVDEESGLIFTADCIIDNREEIISYLLKTESERAELISLPDGDLIYRLFYVEGPESFRRLRGLYSIAVYDKTKDRLILASDPVSARCLYYSVHGEEVIFSTLIDGILAYRDNAEINREYIEDFLMAPGLMPNLMSDYTPYKGIMKLNPGVWLEISEGKATEHEYFKIDEKLPDCKCRSAKEYGAFFRKLYEQCVAGAVNIDADIAIAMSSGLDSASIGVLAARELEKKNKRLKSFTYVPAIDGASKEQSYFVLDETEDVKKIAEPYNNIDLHFVNNEGKNCFEDLPQIIDSMEIPFKAFGNFPNLCEIYGKAAELGCKIVLSGQTGNGSVSHGYIDDVLFEYYLKHRYLKMLLTLNQYSKTVGESRKKAIKGCFGYFAFAKEAIEAGIGEYKNYNSFLKESFVKGYPYKQRFKMGGLQCFERVPMDSKQHKAFISSKAMYTYMGEYETKLGLAYGIVIRDATKDSRMLRFCYSLPHGLFAYKGTPRWLIRGNMRDVLPTNLLDKWMRYGVQNVDCLLRVKRDWKKLNGSSTFNSIDKIDLLNDYVDGEKLQKFIDEFENLPESDVSRGFDEMGYIYVCKHFLQRC